jgi:hypothetical protein
MVKTYYKIVVALFVYGLFYGVVSISDYTAFSV